MKRPLGAYIHIPFCRTKCPYCAFNSVAGSDFSPHEWTDLLKADFSSKVRAHGLKGEDIHLRSIYFGGGTPSVFPPEHIGEIIALVRETFRNQGGDDDSVEVTLEANPGDLGPALLEGYLKAGVNRLSIGLQSLEGGELKTLGRRHGPDEGAYAIKSARSAGFTNISVDLMYGIPGQTLSSWRRTLEGVLAPGPDHVSLYCLSIEENTPFFGLYHGDGTGQPCEKSLLGEELELAMYEEAVSFLTVSGFIHYEISNFSRLGLESAHNSGYWLGGEYLGIGPGAHSFLAEGAWGRRSWNETDLKRYKDMLARGNPCAGSELLTREEAMVEAVFLGLRMPGAGLDLSRYERDFGRDEKERLLDRCALYETSGHLISGNGRIRLSSAALFICDEVCANLVSGPS